MSVDWPTIAVMVGIGGLLWRQIAALAVDVRDVRRDLTEQIAAVNTRIDNILLAKLQDKA